MLTMLTKTSRRLARAERQLGQAEATIDELEQCLVDIWHVAQAPDSGRRQQRKLMRQICSDVKNQIPDVADRDVTDPQWLRRLTHGK
jgi:uncharacterized coiled-coil protein SlyX